MKFIFAISLTVLASPAMAEPARKPAAAETKCVVVAKNGDNLKFEATNEKVDEYLAIEKKEHGGYVFKFMGGHGQQRLAAYKGGKLYAATFGPEGTAEQFNLMAGEVQAGCTLEEAGE